MNDSQCSSGCESGWTLYLEHSLLSPYPNSNHHFLHDGDADADARAVYSNNNKEEEGVEEEDLSMVSDASSGPPIFQEDEYFRNADTGFLRRPPVCAAFPKSSGKKNKKSVRGSGSVKVQENAPSCLDDTASSPIFDFSQSNFTLTNNQASMEGVLGFSQVCSGTHFEGRSTFHEPFGFFQTSPSGNHLQQNQWYGGKMGM
ncbi:protein SOB FIVE-LIKE 5-like [Diospyros lotus]|uniref:protein SOB FIVE-LIKE 5-like n=1 Tax=Diospyros lotus TaxID=55363 RepID=UPI002256FDC6|nr:protein SOB FIVE-LIKE 5-like [Diospyros lotus]